MTDVPHFRTPFQIVGSAALVVEQDSSQEVEQCVEAILRTTTGSRLDNPKFGVPDRTFTEIKDNGDWRKAIAEFEPRAQYTLTDDDIDALTKRVQVMILSAGDERGAPSATFAGVEITPPPTGGGFELSEDLKEVTVDSTPADTSEGVYVLDETGVRWGPMSWEPILLSDSTYGTPSDGDTGLMAIDEDNQPWLVQWGPVPV